MIDLHAHLLPGIDDGPEHMDVAVAMARRALDVGTQTVVCTPHRSPRHRTAPALVHEAVAELRRALAGAGVPLEVLPGLEIAMSEVPGMGDDELRAATLGGGGRWLLIEMPFKGWPIELSDMLADLEIRGFSAVIAHPERASSVQTSPDRVRDLVGRGALLQLTAGSLAGDLGPGPLRAGMALARAGLAHLIASDMHGVRWRPPGLSEGLAAAAAELGVTADALSWAVREGPELIVAGERAEPPRPKVVSRTPRPDAPPAAPAPRRARRRSPGAPR
ncbi:MAG TPA: CpsB/CapC family capsule biosynthesis tyrosine phosphatase [Miltoncostaeaceae bacterium]|nr:CpsB/CapC family capsule biosynthesis tyrosine phosphatase [Miltoncostaeaceae bacterium]